MTAVRHRYPRHCAVPPHMLDKIARNGTDDQRSRALSTMSLDTSQRSVRVQNALMHSRQKGTATPRLFPTVEPRRTIGDAKGEETLPGVTVRTEGQPPTDDVAVNEAYDGLGATFDFFLDVYGRNSIDDDGMDLRATVHYGERLQQRLLERPADGVRRRRRRALQPASPSRSTSSATSSTHGVTEDEAGLMYRDQPGALNESMSRRVRLARQAAPLKQTADEADWLIGEGLFADAVDGRRAALDEGARHRLRRPGARQATRSPPTWTTTSSTTDDNGGVHINSGIPNKAFYLAATALGGYAWERAGRIWYDALRAPQLRPNASFRAFAALTVRQAQLLFGTTSDEIGAIQDAWRSVGVKV